MVSAGITFNGGHYVALPDHILDHMGPCSGLSLAEGLNRATAIAQWQEARADAEQATQDLLILVKKQPEQVFEEFDEDEGVLYEFRRAQVRVEKTFDRARMLGARIARARCG